MRLMLGLVLAGEITGALVSSPARAAPVGEDAFLVRSTGDLVTLCAADKADSRYTAAQNFCHGFAVATYRAIVDVQRGLRSEKKLFCEPAAINRNDAIAAFVGWAQAHNDLMALPPTDGIVKFLQQQYPCG